MKIPFISGVLARACAMIVLACAVPTGAWAQAALLQGGAYADGHVPAYVGQGSSNSGSVVVQDSGPAGGGGTGISEIPMIMRGAGTPPYSETGTGALGTNFCDYDAPITNATGYHYLCFGPNAGPQNTPGTGLITYGYANGASPLALLFNINGVNYNLADFLTGIAVGSTPLTGGTLGNCLTVGSGVVSSGSCGGTSALVVGTTTITGGNSGHVEYNNAGVLGELATTGSGSVVLSTSPTLTTPNLGTPSAATLTNATGLPLSTGVTGLLPISNGGTGTSSPGLVAGSNITITGSWPNQTIAASGGGSGTVTSIATTSPITGGTITTTGTIACPTCGVTGSPLSQFASTTSSQLAGIISDATGSGSLVFATSPTLTTPSLGVATATSINKVAITAPATSATLTIANGKTLTDTSGIGADLLLGATGGGFTAYAGASCTNQVLSGLSAAGAANSCVSITNSYLTAGTFSNITGTGTLTAGATGSGFTIALSTSTLTGNLPLTNIATIGSNDILANVTSGTASPTAVNVASCSAASDALIWTTNTGPGCNTSITAASVPASGLTGSTLASGVTGSSLTGVGTLTSGATGSGFTIALGTSTISGTLGVAHGGTGDTTFTANLPLIGNGTSAIAQGTVSGNTTLFMTGTGAFVSGDCAQFDASGNIEDFGSGCGGSGGGGTPGGSTYAVQTNAGGGNFGGVSLGDAQLLVGQTSAAPLAKTMSGDGTLADTGAITITKTNGTAFSSLATATAGTGLAVSGGALNLQPSAASTIGGVESITSASHEWIAYIDTSGIPHQSQPAFTDISGSLALTSLATQTTNTVVGNATSGSASPTALSMPSCSAAADALIWTTNTGFGCNTSITANAVPAANLTGSTLASGVTASSLTSVGTLTALNVSGATAHTGTFAENDAALPTQAAGTLGVAGGSTTQPTLGANDEGDVFLSTTLGLQLIGQGSTDDVAILNKSKTTVIAIATGATVPTLPGLTTAGLVTTTSGGVIGSEAAVTAGQFPALTGDVTTPGSSLATTIAANAVTYAKFQQVAAVSLVGNPTGSTANAEGITLGTTLNFSGTTLNATTATTSQLGVVKPDGTTITISGGVISASGGVASSIDAGGATTSITNGTNGALLVDIGGYVSKSAAITSGDLIQGGGTSAPTDSNIAATNVMTLSGTQTVTGAKTFNTSELVINGGSATAGLATATSGGVISSEANATVAQGGTNCTSASGTCLDNITGFSSTGLIDRTGSGTYSFTAPGTGVLTALGNAVNGSGGMLTYSIIGTSGATVPLLNGTATISGAWTFNTSDLVINGGSATAGLATVTSGGVVSSEANATVGQGGTGLTSYTTGQILYASGSTTLAGLSDVATGALLASGGTSTAPSYCTTCTATILNASTGFEVNGAATNTNILEGNGSQFVSTPLATTTQIWDGNAGSYLDAGQVFNAAGTPQSLSGTTSVTPNFNSGFNFTFTATTADNYTLQNPTNMKAGQSGCIILLQPPSGSVVTIAFGGDWDFAGGTAPTLTATLGAEDLLCYWVQSSSIVVGTMLNNVN